MTDDEKRAQMIQRDDAIKAYYLEGHTVRECASHFRLNRSRIYQLLCKAGVDTTRPSKSKRNKFLGVNVSEETKDALKAKADEQGTSVSRFASDALDAAVAK